MRQVEENDRSREIVGSMAALGRSLGFQIVAEYVENKKTRDILLELGCGVFQGFLYSPAVPLEDFLQGVKENLFTDR